MSGVELQRTYRGDAEVPEPVRRNPAQHNAPERALLIASLPTGDAEEADRIAEVRELLRTAGVELVGVVVQHRDRPDPRTYLGRGKLDELIEYKREIEPDVIVAEGELSPSQQRHLEDRLKLRVVDRTAVILDIFAQHATSAEGKLQVELAQLEYSYARQEGLWQHLERLGGGVGTRGPGESQLESDRRMIRTRAALLRRRIRDLEGTRRTMRQRRVASGITRVALTGYTNAGKSTLLNALTGSDVSARDALFETLDPTIRAFEREGIRVLVTDTVGFIRQLPHELVAAFRSTLDEVQDARLILHVADASADDRLAGEQSRAVEQVLGEIGAAEVPRLLVLNKCDMIDGEARAALARRHPDAVLVSAKTGDGVDALVGRLLDVARSELSPIDLVVPYALGAIVSRIYATGREIVQTPHEDGSHIRALLPTADAARVRAEVEAAAGGGRLGRLAG